MEEQLENGVPLTDGLISSLHAVTDLHYVASTGGMFYEDVR